MVDDAGIYGPGLMSREETARWKKTGGVTAQGSDDDIFCEALEERGILLCYDAVFGNNYYFLLTGTVREFDSLLSARAVPPRFA